MTTYPSTIKTLDAASFTESYENVAAKSGDMEGGYVISRPKFTRAPRRTWTFNYVEMSDAEKKKLSDFWILVKGSSAAFDWKHPISGLTINVRFAADMKMNFKRIGFAGTNVWESETVQIEEI